MKAPIHFIMDDSSPFAWEPPGFLDRFCDIVEKYGMAGNFSVIPMERNLKADIINGYNKGEGLAKIRAWVEKVKRRLGSRFDFCPEILTHGRAVDINTMTLLEQTEWAWSYTQNRETLIPYFVKALSLLKETGIEVTGYTSPWDFGAPVEEEYIAAMLEAQKRVFGRKLTWYFLHYKKDGHPWVAGRDGEHTLVSIPATYGDYFMETDKVDRTDDEFALSIANKYITADGKNGEIIRTLENGGWPIINGHWWSLASGGRETGLKAFEILGSRITEHLSDRVAWKNATELAEMTYNSERT